MPLFICSCNWIDLSVVFCPNLLRNLKEFFVKEGYDVTPFNILHLSSGQTGSGKTFTMMGPGFDESSESLKNVSRGIIPRSLEYLFAKINNEFVAVR